MIVRVEPGLEFIDGCKCGERSPLCGWRRSGLRQVDVGKTLQLCGFISDVRDGYGSRSDKLPLESDIPLRRVRRPGGEIQCPQIARHYALGGTVEPGGKRARTH